MNLKYRLLLVLLGLTVTTCAGRATHGVAHEKIRPGLDLPHHFLISTETGAVEPANDGNCHGPLVDPRDGTKLTMVRSANGMGDYSAPEGRYGIGDKELLRVECATGIVIGIVHR